MRSPITHSVSDRTTATTGPPLTSCAKLATALNRALDRKAQAGYESVDLGATDAASCVKWADQLLVAAEARLAG